MTSSSYLRGALLVPIVAPLVLWLLGIVFPTTVTIIAGFTGIYLVILFGIPYLIIAWLAWRWSSGRNEAELRRCAWWAPLLFTPLALTSYIWIGSPIRLGQLASTGAWLLAVGYLYVFMIMLSVRSLKRRSPVDNPNVSGGA